MRLLLTLLLIVLLGLSVTACGTVEKTRSAVLTSADGERVISVSRTLGQIDVDDPPVLDGGHAASPAELAQITALVKRYYAAAVAGEGAKACSMLYVATVRSVRDEQGRLLGLHNGACSTIMSKLFRLRHRQLIADLASFQIVRVRTERTQGRVFLRFSTSPQARELSVWLVDGTWQIAQALDTPTP